MINFSELPKVDLHLHLDCSLSYEVVRKIDPSISRDQYQREFVAPEKCINLTDFLTRSVKGFQLMQTQQQLEWVVEDLFDQLLADNTLYAEIRFAPHLHLAGGLSAREVVVITEAATRKASQQTGIEARLILCTLRHFSREQSMETAMLTDAFRNTLVAGFDVAGDEAGYPLDNHVDAFEWARQKGIYCTAHAGEACGPESVWETLEKLRPSRIGHGVRSAEDERLVEHLRRNRIHLEICPNCNVAINIYDTLSQHPIDNLYRAGVSLNVNSDNRTITPITLTREYDRLHRYFEWSIADFYQCNLNALKAAFIDEATRENLIARLTEAYNRS
jgi:adenosine deaminase